jgi:glucose-6-phosphate 1-epimerase
MANAPNVAPGEGGLPRVVLTSVDGGRTEVYLHGAHVARWTTAPGDDVLFLSPRSRFEPGQAIRGGIPIIFPQFADQGPLPKHGFARTAPWTLAEASANTATLVLADTPETRTIWDYAFRAKLLVELSDALSTTLTVHNTGDRAFDFTCAMHSYFRIGSIEQAEVHGLDGVRFRDKVSGETHIQLGDRLSFRGERDRVYVNAPDTLRIRDIAENRTITIEKHGFPDAVVWNPWAAKAREMSDLGEDQYPRFVCVEAACAAQPVRLDPGGTWEGGQVIRVECR